MLGLLLQMVTPTVPVGTQSIEPLSVIAQERSDKDQEEESVFFVSNAADNRAAFLSPDPPPALASYHIRRLQSGANPTGTAKRFLP